MMLAQLQYIKYSILAVLLFSSCAGDGPLNSGSDKSSTAFVKVAGIIESSSYDQEQNRFTCSWNEDENIQQPSTFFLPGVNNADALDIKLNPDGKGLEVKYTDLTSGTILSIESAKKNLYRELVINF